MENEQSIFKKNHCSLIKLKILFITIPINCPTIFYILFVKGDKLVSYTVLFFPFISLFNYILDIGAPEYFKQGNAFLETSLFFIIKSKFNFNFYN
jgi:hypothetical protein